MKNSFKIAMAVLLLGVAAPALAQDETTVDDVRKSALETTNRLMPVSQDNSGFINALVSTYEKNPTLKAARAQTRAVFEELPQADAGWRPTAEAQTGITYTDVDTKLDGGAGAGAYSASGDNTSKDAALTVSQPLYRGGSTVANIEAAKNTIKSQIAFLDQTEQQILLDAATAYLNVLQNDALLKLAVNNQDVLKQQFGATRERFDVGELTRTDVSQAEARAARAAAEVIAAQGNLKSSRARFEQLIGYQPVDIAFAPLPVKIPATLEEAVTFAEQWNPGVRSAQYAQAAAAADINSIYGELLPHVALSGTAGKSYEPGIGIDSTETNTIGVVARIPLYEAGATRSRVRQAKQSANQRMSQIGEAKRATREAVVTAWETLAAARAEKVARMSQVEAAEVARFGVKQEADLGARTILDTLDADQELLDAKVALVSAVRDEAVALYSLAAAMGVFNPQNLGFGDKVPDYNKEVAGARANLFSTAVDRVKP